MRLRRIIGFSVGCLSLLGWMSVASAGSTYHRPNLSRVVLNMSAEQWVKTDSAKIIVQVDATVGQAGLAKMHQGIMHKLNQIVSGTEWYVTRFNRRQDSSGLESVQITAQARVAQKALIGVRPRVESLTRAGERYRVVRIDFQPSEAAREAVRANLRTQLYRKAKAEVARLNEVYPNRAYRVRMVNFTPTVRPMWRDRAMRSNLLVKAEVAAPSVSSGTSVSNKMVLTARVVIASDWSTKDNDD